MHGDAGLRLRPEMRSGQMSESAGGPRHAHRAGKPTTRSMTTITCAGDRFTLPGLAIKCVCNRLLSGQASAETSQKCANVKYTQSSLLSQGWLHEPLHLHEDVRVVGGRMRRVNVSSALR